MQIKEFERLIPNQYFYFFLITVEAFGICNCSINKALITYFFKKVIFFNEN